MSLPDTTLDFENHLLKSKVYESKSSYGVVNYREMATICFVKKIADSWYENNYNPVKFFSCYGAKEHLKGNLTFSEQQKLSLEDYKKYNTVTYSVLLEDDNKDWFEKNKEFLKSLPADDSRKIYLKHKELPVGDSLDKFIAWHIVSLDYFDDNWMKENNEYIEMWRNEITHQHNLFLEAVENENMKGIKKAHARLVDLKVNNQKAMDIAVEKDNEQIVKYLIGKNFTVYQKYLDNAKSEGIKEIFSKIILKDEKKVARTKKMKP